MTHTSLADVSAGSLQRLHRIAHANGWSGVEYDARDAMTRRQVEGRDSRKL